MGVVWLSSTFRKSLRISSTMKAVTNLSTEDGVAGERSSSAFSLVLCCVSVQGKEQIGLQIGYVTARVGLLAGPGTPGCHPHKVVTWYSKTNSTAVHNEQI